MTEDTVEKVAEDFDGQIVWDGPVEIEEKEPIDFTKKITGKYYADILELKYDEFPSKAGDVLKTVKMKLACKEDVSGDPSNNRWLDATYWLSASKWDASEISGWHTLMNGLKSSGLCEDWMWSGIETIEDVKGIVEKVGLAIKDKRVYVSAYPNKAGYQQANIVKRRGKDVDDSPKSKFEV